MLDMISSMNKEALKDSNLFRSTFQVRTILLFCLVISLYFNSELADPFNSAKQFLLLLASSWLLGYFVLTNYRQISLTELKLNKFVVLVVFFCLFGFISLIKTDQKFVGIFGETQRKTGLITYICLSIFILFTSKNVTYKNSKQIYYYVQFTLAIFLIYGTMQLTGNDFVDWLNNYNSIIGTLGNPNFASAFMAMMACISFSAILFKPLSKVFKYVCVTLLMWSIFLIYQSDSKQGLVTVAAGIAFIVSVKIVKFNLKAGLATIFSFFTLGLFAVLGMLQVGPLTYFLYKDSVTLRGYYWNAGINMFTQNPLFGVGLDRYGANFNQYKYQEFVLDRGFDLISTNAHNIPIQIFATGGALFGALYLAINFYILARGLKGLKRVSGDQLTLLSGVFGAWIAYQSQALVSIENIGTAVWGWFFGGCIVGLTSTNNKIQTKSNSTKVMLQPLVSMVLVLMMLIPVTNLYRMERLMMRGQELYNSNNPQFYKELQEVSKAINSNKFADPFHKLASANFLLGIRDSSNGLNYLKKLNLDDERNTQVLYSLANYYESIGDKVNAIKYRVLVSKFDPYNCKNYLRLGLVYKSLGDYVNMNLMLRKINEINPNSDLAKAANQELKV